MIIDLNEVKDFILSEKFLDIQTKDVKQIVLDKLGEPINFTPQKKSSPEILSYGAVDFYLLDNQVNGFSFYKSKTELYSNITYKDITKKEVDDFLNGHRISFESEKSFLNDDCVYNIGNKNLIFQDDILISFGMYPIS